VHCAGKRVYAVIVRQGASLVGELVEERLVAFLVRRVLPQEALRSSSLYLLGAAYTFQSK
jgi:hypothetical protein